MATTPTTTTIQQWWCCTNAMEPTKTHWLHLTYTLEATGVWIQWVEDTFMYSYCLSDVRTPQQRPSFKKMKVNNCFVDDVHKPAYSFLGLVTGRGRKMTVLSFKFRLLKIHTHVLPMNRGRHVITKH